MDELCFQNTRKVAEYFVICGLPKSPTAFAASEVSTHTEEILIPDVAVDFTRFQEPIVDIEIVSVRDNEEIPYGYNAIRRTHSGRFRANIKGRIGDEVYICYRRGRDKPPITDIAMFTDTESNRLYEDAVKITKTCGGRSANFRSSLVLPVYLSYRRAPADSGVDRLAVTDMCIIIPSKHESCPPAFNQIAESLNSNPLTSQMYLCFRKSLIKQHIITYDPGVLSWYRVRDPSMEFATDSAARATLCNPQDLSNEESDNAPLDPDIRQVANFCLPWGAAIESWSIEQEPPEPNFFTFVLTNETYQRLYGVAFTFYEPYDLAELDMDKCYRLGVDPELLDLLLKKSVIVDELDVAEKKRIAKVQKHFMTSRIGDRVIGVTKTMCLLSRWSFTVAFTNFLAFLYSRWQPAAKDDPIPFERYLAHFLCEVPFPTQIMPHVMVELCAAPILLNYPEDNDAVSKCEPFFFLLDCLGVDLTIQLFVQMLTEQKILLTSVKHFLLTQIGEALTSMIFPLRWTVVYIPFIYIGCVHVIQSPSPYLIGVDSRFFDFFRLPPGGGVTYVDLDTKHFKLSESTTPNQPVIDATMLPKKPMKQLKAVLTKLFARIKALRPSRARQTTNVLFRSVFSQAGSSLANNELTALQRRQQWLREFAEMATIGLRIKNSLMHFMAQLLKDYRRFLIPVRQAEKDVLFNTQGFLKEAAEKHSRPFYQALFETQQWANFVRDRSYVSSRDEELSQFDSYMARLFGASSEHSPFGSQTLSDSPSSSIHAFGDGSSDAHSHSGSTNSADGSDEPYLLKMLSTGSIPNGAVHVIGPPRWPLSNVKPQLSSALEQRKVQETIKPLLMELDTKLLDLIISHICREHIVAAVEELNGLDVLDNGIIPFKPVYSSSRSASSHNLLPGVRHLPGISKPEFACHVTDPLLVSLMTSDNPSPFNSRSMLAATSSLTGIPTQHLLPVGGSVILRRPPLELHQTNEFVKRASFEGGLAWAHHIVGTIYSLWFMLLPSYLASIYCSTSEKQSSIDKEHGLHALNEVLSKAVDVACHLSNRGVVCPDQVMLRIILVLVYQHRPPDIDLISLLDSKFWNSSSMVLVNLIFKTFEKECQEKERRMGQVAHLHRRSASLTCTRAEPLGMGYDNSPDRTLNQTREASHFHDIQSNIESQNQQQPDIRLTHHRSSSSVVPSTTSPAACSFSQNKSDTDSGLLINVVGDDSPIDDDHAEQSNISILTSEVNKGEKLTGTALVKQFERISVSGKLAPLASVNELDLGYSTLNRPELSTENFSLTSTQASETISSPTVNDCSKDGAGLEQACLNQFPLETVQKPPLDMVKQPTQPVVWHRMMTTKVSDGDCNTTVNLVQRVNINDESESSSNNSSSSSNSSRPPSSSYAPNQTFDNPHVVQSSERIDPITNGAPNPRMHLQECDKHTDYQSLTMGHDVSHTCSQKPRVSLNSLNTALSKFGKSTSVILSRLNIPVRDWLGTTSPNAPLGDYTPWSGRRATSAGLTTPGSAKITRRPLVQFSMGPEYEDNEQDRHYLDIVHQTASSPDFSSDQTIEFALSSANGLPLQRRLDLKNYTNLWLTVAGPMANGNQYRRSFPATLATLKRCQSNSLAYAAQPISGPLPPRVPTRSSSMEPCTGHRIVQQTQVSDNSPSTLTANVASHSRESLVDHLDAPKSSERSTSTTPVASNCSPKASSNELPVESKLLTSHVCRLNVIMTTCNACPSCMRFVHDEEITAAWSPDENEYSVSCPFCDASFVPKITVRILGDVCGSNQNNLVSEARSTAEASLNPNSAPTKRRGSISSSTHRRTSPSSSRGLMEFTQHYLSPFVLRKSLETVIQQEGDECLRVQSPGHCFLYKHEQLTWNLVWYTQRIGLLTNLLDTLPSWLMDQQLRAQKLVSNLSGTGPATRRTESGSIIPDALLQVQLSSNLPVMISLRWNSYQMARSKANTPLYKQFLSIREESTSKWALVPGGREQNPVLPAGTLGLSTLSDCPVDATIARMLNAIHNHNIAQALDTLISFRACILDGKPISKVISHGSSGNSQPSEDSNPPGTTSYHGNSKSTGCRARCTDSHQGAWCLKGSLYRELLFFTLTAVQPAHFDILSFDDEFYAAYMNYRANDYPYLNETDGAPCFVAAAVRQMLRPLTLVP